MSCSFFEFNLWIKSNLGEFMKVWVYFHHLEGGISSVVEWYSPSNARSVLRTSSLSVLFRYLFKKRTLSNLKKKHRTRLSEYSFLWILVSLNTRLSQCTSISRGAGHSVGACEGSSIRQVRYNSGDYMLEKLKSMLGGIWLVVGVILRVKTLFYALKIIIPCCSSCALDGLWPSSLSFMLFFMYSIENLEILAKKIEFFSKKPFGVPRKPSFPVWCHCFRKK